MSLQNLKPNPKRNKKRIRRGRGNASGKGNFSTKGMKGQTARSGGRRRPGFEGGQMPLMRRMPKLGGFKCPNRVEYQVVNLTKIEENFTEKEVVNLENLYAKRIISKKTQPVKILGHGELKKALTFEVAKISHKALEKIEKAKGTVKGSQPASSEKKEDN